MAKLSGAGRVTLRKWMFLFLLLPGPLGSRLSLHAQPAQSETLAVKVLDQTTAVISGAEIRVVPLGGGEVRGLRTDAKGMVSIRTPIGPYELTVTSPGSQLKTKNAEITEAVGRSETLLLIAGTGGPVELIGERVAGSEDTISPSRPVRTRGAPRMQVKLLKDKAGEQVYAVIFGKADEVLSGLTDFALEHHVTDAHFTGIGAVSRALVGWLDLRQKVYRAIPVSEQVEVLSLIGDVAMFNAKPVVHAHMVLGRADGSTVGGHRWEAFVSPTLEVFVTVNSPPLQKTLDDESGMKIIDLKR